MKLTGTQAQILTAAAAHPHGLALPPDRLPAAARQTVGKALLKAGLVTAVEEQDAEAGALWRIDGEPTLLRVTDAGMAAIGAELAAATSNVGAVDHGEQDAAQGRQREAPREYLDRESHYVWGRRCLLTVVEHDAPQSVEWRHHRLVLAVRPGMDEGRRGEVLEAWYREQLREEAKPLTAEWECRLGVRVDRVFIQRMKTRWGSCNPASHAIRLNTDLAKKPRECLEYILVHELVHLLDSNLQPQPSKAD